MMNLLVILFLLPISDTNDSKNCDYYFYKLVESSKEWRNELKHTGKQWRTTSQLKAVKVVYPTRIWVRGFHFDSSLQMFCFSYYSYVDDDFVTLYRSYYFEPKTKSLFISNTNSGEDSKSTFHKLKYKKKWFRRYLKCTNNK